MPSFFRDDNHVALHDGHGLRPLTSAIISATLSGSTQELTLPTLSYNEHNNAMVRIAVNAQGAFYAFDTAGQSGSYTGITNMILLPPNTVDYVPVPKTATRVYVLQLGTAGSFQLAALT